MNSSRNPTTENSEKLSDGYFLNNKQPEGNERICRISDVEIRVWGAQGIRALPQEITSVLRTIIKKAQQQLPIALMPDYHLARYGVVGTVIPNSRVVVPDLIGGDCGCGVYAACTELKIQRVGSEKWQGLYKKLISRIPVGTATNREVRETIKDLSLWEQIGALPFVASHDLRKLKHQLGSLGSGNHFIEISADETGTVWIVIHSGSKYLGGLLNAYYHQRVMPIDHPDVEQFFKHQHAILEFARISRLEMGNRVLECLLETGINDNRNVIREIDLTHNFVEIKSPSNQQLAIHRKGACSAEKGQAGIIPGSMGTGTCIVEGRGSPVSYSSSSHGSGRKFSREDAFHALSTKEFLNDMKGIVWSGSQKLKDEAPRAYKNLDSVMKAQRDLVQVCHRLKPILSVKG